VVRAIKGLCGEAHGLGFDSPWDKTSDLSGELWRWVAALAPYMGLVSPKVGTCYKKKKKKKIFLICSIFKLSTHGFTILKQL
jgi:hypothetical protein